MCARVCVCVYIYIYTHEHLISLYGSTDKSIASCDILENPKSLAIKTDLIENKYNAGSIVWAYIKDFPWWPGIINDCPETFTYYKLPKNSLKPIRYYVTFFTEGKLECAWIHKRNIKPFVSHNYNELINETKFHGIDYEQRLQKAYNTAANALSLSILERLKQFSFVAQYEKDHDINNNLSQSINNITKPDILSQVDTNSDDEIPCSNPIRRQFTLKEYYLGVLCKSRDTL
ncbi:PREDICTED: zinc finger CW-type PWWP domain protein 1-like [Eufriesea mexicana]|uniref:zinc finger CW-type PWWP domain protein 1-like n=1 Tax=Eufriesea mexicana TaxID=516756 RepID=UPI00083C130A|nr:PREDICTED: zinc finger CW-type PWWP domain protein 1-like [Eufriesea mexicana]